MTTALSSWDTSHLWRYVDPRSVPPLQNDLHSWCDLCRVTLQKNRKSQIFSWNHCSMKGEQVGVLRALLSLLGRRLFKHSLICSVIASLCTSKLRRCFFSFILQKGLHQWTFPASAIRGVRYSEAESVPTALKYHFWVWLTLKHSQWLKICRLSRKHWLLAGASFSNNVLVCYCYFFPFLHNMGSHSRMQEWYKIKKLHFG